MRRLTSSLNVATNDTGRIAYCGPIVLSAITGMPVSRVEDEIWKFRRCPEEDVNTVKGTTEDELQSALEVCGFRMDKIDDFTHLERKARPSVWSWMQKPRSAWTHYVLGISKGKQGHWIVIRGVKLCDTFTDGRWVFVSDGPHKGVKIECIFAVRKN